MAVNDFLNRLAVLTEDEPKQVVEMYADQLPYKPEKAYPAAWYALDQQYETFTVIAWSLTERLDRFPHGFKQSSTETVQETARVRRCMSIYRPSD